MPDNTNSTTNDTATKTNDTEVKMQNILAKTKDTPSPPSGPISETNAEELNMAETLVRTAQREPHLAKLTERGISTDGLIDLAGDIVRCRGLLQQATHEKGQITDSTHSEGDAETLLVEAIRQVQAAASQKYKRDPAQAGRLSDYHIGAGLTRNRAQLAQAAEGILQQLATDTLPGVTDADKAALKALRDTWSSSDSAQAQHKAASQSVREEAKALLKTITDRRITLQYAAEALYPYTRAENAPHRTEFSLPANRPFRG